MTICPKCGNLQADGSEHCGKCGAEMPKKIVFTTPKNNYFKEILCVLLVVAVFLGTTVATSFILNKSPAVKDLPQKDENSLVAESKPEEDDKDVYVRGESDFRPYSLYIMDGDLYYNSVEDNLSYLVEEDYAVYNEEDEIEIYAYLTNDHSKLFYLTHRSSSRDLDLCVRDLKNQVLDEEGDTVKKDVQWWAVDKNGAYIVLKESDSSSLYVYDVDKDDLYVRTKKVDELVAFSPDGAYAVYSTTGDELHAINILDNSAEATVLSKAYCGFEKAEADKVYFYTLVDGSCQLDCYTYGGEVKTLLAGIDDAWAIYDSGEIYGCTWIDGSTTNVEAFYYDGTEKSVMCSGNWAYLYASENEPMIVIGEFEDYDLINLAVATGNTGSIICSSPKELKIADDGSILCYIDKVTDNRGSLYSVDLASGNLEPKLVESDISYNDKVTNFNHITLTDRNNIIYFKDYYTEEDENGNPGFVSGLMYINGEQVDSDVTYVCDKETYGNVVYTKDEASNSLYLFGKDGKKRISTDASNVYVEADTLVFEENVMSVGDYATCWLNTYDGDSKCQIGTAVSEHYAIHAQDVILYIANTNEFYTAVNGKPLKIGSEIEYVYGPLFTSFNESIENTDEYGSIIIKTPK